MSDILGAEMMCWKLSSGLVFYLKQNNNNKKFKRYTCANCKPLALRPQVQMCSLLQIQVGLLVRVMRYAHSKLQCSLMQERQTNNPTECSHTGMN